MKHEVVDVAIDDDSLQLTSASIRTVVSIEKLIGVQSKINETKAPTPLKSLYDLQSSSNASTKSVATSQLIDKRNSATSSPSSIAVNSVPLSYGSTKRAMKRVR